MTTPRHARRADSLTRERVLSAAVDVLDREGLEALSMRRLGVELGVEAMSLYRYVPSKADLLDGIHGTILEEMAVPRASRSWKTSLRAHARAFRAVLVAHPHALPLFAMRPAVSPVALRHVESGLALLRGAGFDVDDALSAFQIVVAFVVGHTMSTHATPAGDERGTPVYRELPGAEFPYVIEASRALAEHDVERELEMGLDVVLDGLETRLAKRRGALTDRR